MRFPFPETVAIAHRGAHGPAHPENSLAAVRRAIELGARMVEFDALDLADGTVVVSHDRRRKLDGASVDLRTATRELLGSALDTSVPRVEPYLRLIAESGVLLNFDWKGTLDGVGRIAGLLSGHGIAERTIVSLGHPAAVARLKARCPEAAVGLPMDKWRSDLPEPVGRLPGARHDHREYVRALIRRSGADALMLFHSLASPEVARTVREEGAGLFLWTANDVETFEWLLRYSPDGIATNVIERQLRAASRS